jgi:hypothetical protein
VPLLPVGILQEVSFLCVPAPHSVASVARVAGFEPKHGAVSAMRTTSRPAARPLAHPILVKKQTKHSPHQGPLDEMFTCGAPWERIFAFLKQEYSKEGLFLLC